MIQPKLLLILALATLVYLHPPMPSKSTAAQTEVSQFGRQTGPAPQPVIIPAPSGYNRWKTGPNAQTDFEPFAPSEQADWNHSSGYTIIAGANMRR